MVLEELGSVASGQGDLLTARQLSGTGARPGRRTGRQASARRRPTVRWRNSAGWRATSIRRSDSTSRRWRWRGPSGDRESIAIGLLNLAMVAIGRGSATSAARCCSKSLPIAAEIGSMPAGQSALEVTAGLASLREDWERAARLFGAAEAQIAQTGLQRDPADEAFLAPLIARTREASGGAAFDGAATSGRMLGYEEATAEVGPGSRRGTRSPPRLPGTPRHDACQSSLPPGSVVPDPRVELACLSVDVLSFWIDVDRVVVVLGDRCC